MKTILIIPMILLIFGSYAQNFTDDLVGVYFKGFRVTANHDTLQGSIKLFPQWIMQRDQAVRQKLFDTNYAGLIKQYSAVNDENLVNYSPFNTIYLALENNTKWYSTRFTSLKAPDDRQRTDADTFLHVMEVGPISYFDYIVINESHPPETVTKAYIQLPTGEAIDFSGMLLGFAKKMSGYVKDFPELSAKIANKEKGYGMTNINSIIREYNAWYSSNHPDFTIMKK